MAEETKIEEQVVTPEVKEEPKADLVTRVSQVKVEPKPEETKQEEGKFNINDLDTHIEKITDPALKEQFVGLKKSLIRGENQKYQEIASLRKQYETKLAEVSSWTPERLQQEMNKPDFVQAAQTLYGSQNPKDSGLTDQQWSALSEPERAELNQLKQKINLLEKTSWESQKLQQDANLKTKYANYAPDVVDTISVELVQGRRQATREDLWKVYDYENAVQRAYELGLMDKKEQNQEKVNGMTYDGGKNIPAATVVQKEKGETTQQFFNRSYQEHTKGKK